MTETCESDCPTERPRWRGTSCTTCALGGPKRAENGGCVEACDFWVADGASGEFQCVDGCPHWWYTEKGGFCRDDAWKKAMLGEGLVWLVFVLVLVGVIVYKLAKERGWQCSGCCGCCDCLSQNVRYNLAPAAPDMDAVFG